MKYTLIIGLSMALFSCSQAEEKETAKTEDVVATESPVETTSTGEENTMDGEFTYTVLSSEWAGENEKGELVNQELGKAQVIIAGDDITVYMEKDTLSGKLMEHKSGKWIISTSEEDINAEEVGGCAGPTTINTEKKTILVC